MQYLQDMILNLGSDLLEQVSQYLWQVKQQ